MYYTPEHTKLLTEIFYRYDPADTSCVENQSYDEYKTEAAILIDHYEQISMAASVSVFDRMFDGLYDVAALYAAIEEFLEKVDD